jgi:hypothetical protein
VISKTSQVWKSTKENRKLLLEGVVLSIDPSIGSTSSQPGWAAYRAGEFLRKGTIPISPELPVWKRLRMLVNGVRHLYLEFNPDVLVYEEITSANMNKFRNAAGHASLLKALGAILSVPGPDGYVGIFPRSWQANARDSYVKSDENDAAELGYVVIELARSMVKK